MIYKIDLNYTDSGTAEKYGLIYQDMKCIILKEAGEGVLVKLLPKFRAEIEKFNKEKHTCWTTTPIILKKCLIHSNMNTLTNE